MHKLLLSLCVLSLLSLVSCKSDPIDPVIEEPTIGAGSTFTFEHQVYDDTLWTDLTSSDTTMYTVASIDTTFGGEINAHYLWSMNDTSVYRMDAQKNLTVYQPEIPIPGTGVVYPESWPVVPIATKEELLVEIDADTAVKIQNLPAIVHTSLISGYTGADSIAINGKTYATVKGFIERNVIVGIGGGQYYTKVYTEYSYAPALKTIVARRQKVWSNHDQSPLPNGGETWTLVKFDL